MNEHLGYEKHDPSGHHSGNSRNGTYPKTLKGSHGEVESSMPRDRVGDFEPQFIEKGQTRLTQFHETLLKPLRKCLVHDSLTMLSLR